ncbi:uncharacterized protein LOC113355225 [Papaver somniferum]|uniref:uncharacterized protein LOC113355225 n=1 Tax=Papaver somniferum TaxID=3469 RepID=UPI000E70327E|nr:uncharacterized protein LOC113355225 [Papaver somniferum]
MAKHCSSRRAQKCKKAYVSTLDDIPEEEPCEVISNSNALLANSNSDESCNDVVYSAEQLNFPWLRFWKANLPPKILHFLWKCVHNYLPVNERLSKHAHNIDDLCPLCKSVPETVDHLLLNCHVSREIWVAVESNFAGITLWNICKARCSTIFENTDLQVTRIVSQIQKEQTEWSEIKAVTEMNECRIVAGGVQLVIELQFRRMTQGLVVWIGSDAVCMGFWNWELHNKLVQLDITREGQEDAVAVADGVMMGRRDYLVKDEPVVVVAEMWRSSKWKLEAVNVNFKGDGPQLEEVIEQENRLLVLWN